MHFLVRALPDVQNQFWKQFRSKVLYNYCSNFFFRSVLERFGQNQKTCTFTFMRFLVRALPEVQNQFWKQFSNKVLYNYNSKFFFRSVSVRTRKSALSLSCIFCLGHFLRSKISFESSFLIKCYIITILNFFFGEFRSEPENLHFHFHAFSGWGTFRGQKSV